MAAEIMSLDGAQGNEEFIARARRVLQDGGLVAFPTETVYGVGVRADDASAVSRLRTLKQRSAEKALTVHIAVRQEIERLVSDVPGLARRFVKKAWPGPLTLILPVENPLASPIMVGQNGSLADALYYDNSLGVRCPDHSIASALLGSLDAPIVASSANRSGQPPPRSGIEVRRSLGDAVDVLLDAGETRYAKPSTIVRIRGESYELIREGVLDGGVIDRLAKVRILFVCTGNTCRSPMAAALARNLIAERLNCDVNSLEEKGVFVTSAGTGGGSGGAAENAIVVMGNRGLDLTTHRSMALSLDMVRQSDYIFTMTRAHRESVLRMAPDVQDRVQLLLDDADVADPFGGTPDAYLKCVETIEKGLQVRLQEVVL